jgi:hypothetical protein
LAVWKVPRQCPLVLLVKVTRLLIREGAHIIKPVTVYKIIKEKRKKRTRLSLVT